MIESIIKISFDNETLYARLLFYKGFYFTKYEEKINKNIVPDTLGLMR